MLQRISRHFNTKPLFNRNDLRFLIICLGLAAMVSGCAVNEDIRTQPTPPTPVETKSTGLFSTGTYRSIVLTDINNDGDLDVIGGSSAPGSVAIWYGDGGGGLSRPQFLPFKGDVRSVAVADIDGDGLKDIICSTQRESVGILIWKNKSGFQWEQAASPAQSGNYEGLAVADLNQDGYVDIAAANSTSSRQGGIQVWFGDAHNSWQRESGPTIKGTYMNVTLADVNQDGAIDLIGTGWGIYGALNVWFGNGTGGWSPAATINRGSYYSASVKDINGDGHIDILAASYQNGVQIFLGNGRGSFTKTAGPADTGSFWSVLVSDLDGDGAEEILAGSLDSKGLLAWRKQNVESWISIQDRFPASGTYYQVAKGDLNKDGRDDLCAATFGEGIQVWLGKGGYPDAGVVKKKNMIKSGERPAAFTEMKENSVFKDIAGTPEYKIGPGDVLQITFWRGTEGKKEEVLVRSDGRISFGFVEDLAVTDLTATQLDQILTEKLSEFIKKPRIDVIVKEFNSKSVTLVGALATSQHFRSGPGAYSLTGKTTLLEMITRAGGPTNDANLNRVNVRRKSGKSVSVDMYKIFTHGDRSQDIILDDGDLVVIPVISKEENRVYVFGEVKKPGVYTFTGTGMHLFDAVSEAGGVTVFARRSSTKIVRGEIARPEVISADLARLVEQGDISQNITLANGDLVYVPRSFVGDINRFIAQITPLMRLIIYPAQVVNEYGRASEWLDITEGP